MAQQPRPDCAGKSILELLWEEMDDVYAELKAPPTTAYDGAELRGWAKGLATAIAIIINPYAPDIDAVRVKAQERWESN